MTLSTRGTRTHKCHMNHHTGCAQPSSFKRGLARFVPSSLAFLLRSARVRFVTIRTLVTHAYFSVSTSPRPRPSWPVGLRDVSWERALLALPDQALVRTTCGGARRAGEILGENVAPPSTTRSPSCISSCISSCLLVPCIIPGACSARVQGT